MRFLISLLVAFSLSLSAPASANIIDTGLKAYTVYKVTRIGLLLVRYGKQLQSISKVAINSRQLGLLKQCFQTRTCASYVRNPTEWTGGIKNKLIQQWETENGMAWPRHLVDVFGKNGKIVAQKGDLYEAHHIIPKNIGGPHEWWNMYPVPRPEHQRVVHAAESFLNQLMALAK
jgi:hypothetical protein